MMTRRALERRGSGGWRRRKVALLWLSWLVASGGCDSAPAPASEWQPSSGGAMDTTAGASAMGTSAGGDPGTSGEPVIEPELDGAGGRQDATSPLPDAGNEGNTTAGFTDAGGSSLGDSAMGAADAGDAAVSQESLLPPVDDTGSDGPFETTQDLRTGPAGDSGVFRPAELGQRGVRHPIFVWGCGGGSTPATYADLMNRVASHGFVVIAETSRIGDDGAPLTAAIDWMIAENDRADSVFHQKLDTSHIGLGGHSIGSVNSFYVAPDPRLSTSIHVAGGSLDDPRDVNAPTTGSGGKGLLHPVAYVCSERDTFGNVEKTGLDYDNTTAPAWMTIMSGVDHTAAAREGLPAIIAWLRWQLAGESDRRGAFLEPAGEFNSGNFVSKHKNW